MIDFHNHILPGCDDGAETLQESMDMLKLASEQGIKQVVNTIHFQHPKMEGKNVEYNYLSDRINELQQELDNQGVKIKLHLTSEVFYLPNLCEIKDNPLTTIGNGKYMLIEFATHIYPDQYEEQFYNLQLDGVTPVIAHPERYRFVQEKPSIMKEWIEKGYVLQVDAGSILGHFGSKIKKLSIKFLQDCHVHLIGSDAHNNGKRNFCLKEAYDKIEEKFSIEMVGTLKNNVKYLLEGKELILYSISSDSRSLFQRITQFIKPESD